MGAVESFIYVKGESCNSWRRKEVLLRNFELYMKDLGLKPYIPVIKTPKSRTHYIPHIYIKVFFQKFSGCCLVPVFIQHRYPRF